MSDENANSANADSTNELQDSSGQSSTESNTDQPGQQDQGQNQDSQKSEPHEEAGEKPNPQQEHDWKKRYEGTAKSLKEKSEQYDRAVSAQSSLVQNNPAYLEELARTDKIMADEVAKKVYGVAYDDYQSSQKIQEMRRTDPESADREERLRNLEMKDSQRRGELRTQFLESKSLSDNKFDPDYQKFDAQMSVLDGKFVENNYQRALEIAYNLAFPSGYSKQDVEQAKKDAILSAQAGQSGGGAPNEQATNGPRMTAEAKNFNAAFKNLLQP